MMPARSDRCDLEYASDLRDAEWALIAPGHEGDPPYRHLGLPGAAIAASLSRLHNRTGLFLPLDLQGTMPPPHEGCRGNNLVILRVVDDRPYPQSSAENKSNRFLIQAPGFSICQN